MTESNQKDINAQLHVQARKEINDIRKDVEQLIKEDLGIRSDMKEIGIKMDKLTERVNEGVSKTVFKTLEKVTEISHSMIELKHDNEKRDFRIDRSEDNLKTVKEQAEIRIKATEKKTDNIMKLIFSVFIAMMGLIASLGIWSFKVGMVK